MYLFNRRDGMTTQRGGRLHSNSYEWDYKDGLDPLFVFQSDANAASWLDTQGIHFQSATTATWKGANLALGGVWNSMLYAPNYCEVEVHYKSMDIGGAQIQYIQIPILNNSNQPCIAIVGITTYGIYHNMVSNNAPTYFVSGGSNVATTGVIKARSDKNAKNLLITYDTRSQSGNTTTVSTGSASKTTGEDTVVMWVGSTMSTTRGTGIVAYMKYSWG